MTFSDEAFFKNANALFKSLQIDANREDNKGEMVSERDAFMALAIIDNLSIDTFGDVYLFCASENLLNRYVKQDNNSFVTGPRYLFKSKIPDVLRTILSKRILDVDLWAGDESRSSVIYVMIGPVIFSYHGVKKDRTYYDIQSQSFGSSPFDGIRKQQCAITILHSALEFEKNKPVKTNTGVDFWLFLNDCLSKFDKGEAKIIDSWYQLP
jgi:hypothetical protein